MRFNKKIALIFFLVISKTIVAQTEKDSFIDTRIKKLLDSKNINYSITKNGDFRINLITEESPKERTQRIFIYSKKESYHDIEILNIESIGFKIPKNSIKMPVLIDLLEKNGALKIGAWSMYEYKSDPEYYSFSFEVKVASNISAEELVTLFNFVGIQADEKEKLWGNGLDEY